MIPDEHSLISPILGKPYQKPLVAYEPDSSEEGGLEKYSIMLLFLFLQQYIQIHK